MKKVAKRKPTGKMEHKEHPGTAKTLSRQVVENISFRPFAYVDERNAPVPDQKKNGRT